MIIALFFVVIFSLFIASILAFTDTGLKAAKSFDAQRKLATSADGAVDAAINRFRGGQPCDDYPAPTDSSGAAINGQPMIVHCKDAVANGPTPALLSLGDNVNEPGIASTSALQRVRGDVYSRSNITVGSTGSMVVEGNVTADGACDQTRIQATSVTCQPVNGVGTRDRDPELIKATSSVPKPQTVPACGADPGLPPWLVKLAPGYYDDADLPGLNSFSTGGACQDVIVWMQPGLYYFNFSFKNGAPGIWTVNDSHINIVGGTPKGWNPNPAAPATAPRPPIGPGACSGPGEAPQGANSGVQAILGGQSRLEVDDGSVELCASPGSSGRDVAVYGLPPDLPTQLLAPSSVVTSANFDPDTLSKALLAGEVPEATADAHLASPAGPSTASITLAGFRPDLPSGSVIDSAILKIRHADDAGIGATFTAGTCNNQALVASPQMAEEVFDLAMCGVATPADVSGLSVRYDATLSSGSTGLERLDGMWVEVSYRVPTTLKPTGVSGNPVGFSDPSGNALEIGEQPTPLTADATLTAANPQASMSLTGFVDLPLPAEAVVDSAKLRVSHGDAAGIAPTVTVGTCTDRALASHTAVSEDVAVDLKADCGLTAPAMFANLIVTYKANLASAPDPSVDHLDGIWLDIVYRPIRRATGTAAPPLQFANPSNAFQIGEPVVQTSDAPLDSGNPEGTIDLNGFGPAVPAPPAVIDSAQLRVAHQEIGDVGAVSVTPAIGTTNCATTRLDIRPPSLFQDVVKVDLTGCPLTSANLADFHVIYDVQLRPGGGPSTDKLDGIELEVATRLPVTHKPGSATSPNGRFQNADPNARFIGDSLTSDANLLNDSPDHKVASVTLGSFDQPPLPSGAQIASAILRVAHQDDPEVATVTLTTSATGAACTAIPPLAHQATMATDSTTDLTSCLNSQPAGLAGLSVTYTADLGGGTGATDRLDGMELELVFRPPTFQPLGGCLSLPYDPAVLANGPCAMVKSTAAVSSSRLIVDGTLYSPSAAVDLAMKDVNSQVVTRGLIARTIALDVEALPSFTRPTIGVPNPESVIFTAYADRPRAASTATPGPVFTQTDADNAKAIDGTFADAHLDSGAPTASLTLTDYDLGAVLPSGSTIDGVLLRVAHRYDGDVGGVTVKVTIPGQTCSPSGVSIPVTAGSSVIMSLVDVAKDCGLSTPIALSDLTGLHVQYTASLGMTGPTADVHLDGIAVEVLAGPMVRSQVDFPLGASPQVKGWSVLR